MKRNKKENKQELWAAGKTSGEKPCGKWNTNWSCSVRLWLFRPSATFLTFNFPSQSRTLDAQTIYGSLDFSGHGLFRNWLFHARMITGMFRFFVESWDFIINTIYKLCNQYPIPIKYSSSIYSNISISTVMLPIYAWKWLTGCVRMSQW